MNDSLTGLEDAVASLRAAWTAADAVAVAAGGASSAPAASMLERRRLVVVARALGAVGRRLDAVRAHVAAEIDRQSRRELGSASLAKQQGFRTGAMLLAETTGISTGDAIRLTRVGNAVAPRVALTGEALPASCPHVAAAVAAGTLTAAAAAAIVSMLGRVALRATHEDRDRAERILASQAPGQSLDHVRTLVARAQAWLDPDGLEPAERDRHGQRSVRLFERDGMLHIDGVIEAGAGAAVKTAVGALVTDMMRRTRDDVIADDDRARPTVAQLQADAMVQLAEHALGCDRGDLPVESTTVIVRVDLDTLREGVGSAEIDGITQPISAAAARHLASAAGVVPCVLDGAGEILDWGRRRRLFTLTQRLALVERDGGCAMCHLPPGMTKAHHIRWWARDAGPTDLRNGVLLCESCHHRIHDNGWEIRIEGGTIAGKVWFIPPAVVDPARTPRLGGRARFDCAPPRSAPAASTVTSASPPAAVPSPAAASPPTTPGSWRHPSARGLVTAPA